MIRFAIFLLVATVLVVAFNWVSENSGSLSFSILEYEISINLVLALIGLLVIVIGLHLLITLLSKIFSIPSSIRKYMQSRQVSKLIENQLELINHLLLNHKEPPHKLIHKVYDALVKLKVKGSILPLKLHSFPKNNSKQGDYTKLQDELKNATPIESAAIYKSLLLNPSASLDEQTYLLLDTYFEKIEDPEVIKSYVTALLTAKKHESLTTRLKYIKRYLPHQEYTDIACFTHYLHALEYKERGELDKAADSLDECIGFRNDFSEAYVLLIDIYSRQKKKSALIKLIKSCYTHCPSSTITEAVLALGELIPISELLSIAQALLKQTPDAYETKLLYVRCCLDVSFNNDAFAKLSELLKDYGKTRRVCILMSELAYRTNGNSAEIIDWMKSALITAEISNNTKRFDIEKLLFINKLD